MIKIILISMEFSNVSGKLELELRFKIFKIIYIVADASFHVKICKNY